MAGTSYTRQSSLTDGDTITASLFNDEYNQLVNAFAYAAAGSTGHQHDGGAGEGGNIEIIGDQDFKNKIIVDSTNNRWSVFVEVGGTAVEQVRIEDGVVYPVTDSDVDLGTDAARFKAAYIDSITATTSLTLGTSITVSSILDEDDMVSNSATALATQQSIKAYVDSQVTAQDLDLTDGTTSISIDLDSEALSVLGGTGVTSTASGNGVTLAIDSTVTTLTGTQTLTNKTLTTPAISGNLTTDGNIDGRDVAADGTKLDTVETNADVTDTANVTAAGALMDSELTSIASVKALNQGVATTDSPTFAAATVTGEITANGGIALGDNDKATFGAGDDLEIYHDGSVNRLDSVSSSLAIKAPQFVVQDAGGTKNMIWVPQGGSGYEVQLSHDGTTKLTTTSTGIDVTGSVVADGLTVDGNSVFTTADNSAQVTLISTDTDALVGPQLNLWRNSGTGTNGDLIGEITFTGEDTVGSTNTFATIYSVADQTNNGSEDGSIHFQTLINGVLADRLEINASGNSVFNGTATMDGLTVDGVSALNGNTTIGGTLAHSSSGGLSVKIGLNNASISSSTDCYIGTHTSGGMGSTSGDMVLIPRSNANSAVQIVTGNGTPTKTATFSHNGDISFYEDTGTTAKLFWDASAERLGIGTSSPSAVLETFGGTSFIGAKFKGYTTGKTALVGTDNNSAWFGLDDGTYGLTNSIQLFGTNNSIVFNTADAQRLTIDSSGKVGIGTSSPQRNLHIHGSGNGALKISNSTLGSGNLDGVDLTLNTSGEFYLTNRESGSTIFETGGSERMRIDSAGNVGIGTSSPAASSANVSVLTLKDGASFYGYEGGGIGISGLSVNFDNIGNTAQYRASSRHVLQYTMTDTTGVHAWSSTASTGTAGATATLVERMRIDSSGRVGIGSGNPQNKLDIEQSAAVSARLLATGATSSSLKLEVKGGATQLTTTEILATSGGALTFATGTTSSTERMRIDSSGNVLVGTTANAIGNAGFKISGVGFARVERTGTTSQSHLSFTNGNGDVGSISTSGTATTYNTSSDQRLKENIADADDAGSKIDAIQVRQYDWKADGSHQDYGMIAQELQAVAPEAVSGDADSEEMMGVDYSKLVPMLIKEIQSLRNRVAQLEE